MSKNKNVVNNPENGVENTTKTQNTMIEEDNFLYLVLPDDVVHADHADRLLLLVGDDSGLSLDPGVTASLGEEAVAPCLALPLREYCNKKMYFTARTQI